MNQTTFTLEELATIAFFFAHGLRKDKFETEPEREVAKKIIEKTARKLEAKWAERGRSC